MKQNKISVWDGEPWQTICIVHQSFTAKNSNESQALCEHRNTYPQSLSRQTNHSCVNPLHNFKVLKGKKKSLQKGFSTDSLWKKYFHCFSAFLMTFTMTLHTETQNAHQHISQATSFSIHKANLANAEKLRKFGLLSLEKRKLWGNLIAVF